MRPRNRPSWGIDMGDRYESCRHSRLQPAMKTAAVADIDYSAQCPGSIPKMGGLANRRRSDPI
jgi:hypothetical protein